MLGLDNKRLDNKRKNDEELAEIRSDVEDFLFEQFSALDNPAGLLDCWTQRRVSEENLAKIALVFAADNPIEHCYQDLIREIDAEARVGIFLTRAGAKRSVLRKLVGESGISGELYQQLPHIAPTLFPDELEHSSKNLDVVWVTIDASYDRAYLNVEVSGLLIARLLGDEDAANDMTNVLRALMYAFHEDLVRRRCGLPLLLNEMAAADLVTMIAELAVRSGDYGERVRAISELAGAHITSSRNRPRR